MLTLDVPHDNSCYIHVMIGTFCLAATSPTVFGDFSHHDADSLYAMLKKDYKENHPGEDPDQDMRVIVKKMRNYHEITNALTRTSTYKRLGFSLLRAHLNNNPRRNQQEINITESPFGNANSEPLPAEFETHARKILKQDSFGATPWCTATDSNVFRAILQYDIGRTESEISQGRNRSDSVERNIDKYIEALNDAESHCKKIGSNQERGVHWCIQLNKPEQLGFQAPKISLTGPDNYTDSKTKVTAKPITNRDTKCTTKPNEYAALLRQLTEVHAQLSALEEIITKHYRDIHKQDACSMICVWDKLNIHDAWQNKISQAQHVCDAIRKKAKYELYKLRKQDPAFIQLHKEAVEIKGLIKKIHTMQNGKHGEFIKQRDSLREANGRLQTLLQRLVYLFKKYILQQDDRWRDRYVPTFVSHLDCFFKPVSEEDSDLDEMLDPQQESTSTLTI